MARLNYSHAMTGVEVPRNEVLSAYPWAIVKLIGFIIASLVVAGLLLLGGAMLAGVRINLYAPAVTSAPLPSMPDVPPAPAPAPPAPTQISVSLPKIRVVTPPQNRQPQAAPASDDEALEQAFKEKLLAEGADP